MSYLTHTQDSRRRATAITATVAIHAAIGFGVIAGLTVAGYGPVDTYDPILEFPTEPTPPEPTATPEPQPDIMSYLPPPPQPPLDLTQDPPPPLEVVDSNETVTTLIPEREIEFPPAPEGPRLLPKRAAPRGNSSNWITNDDYPRRALVDEAEGSVAYRLVIGTNGRVSSCELTRPSGHRALDDATCRLITSRARFDPATDETGARVVGTFTGSVRWQIPH